MRRWPWQRLAGWSSTFCRSIRSGRCIWSAVINGVMVAPIIVVMMNLATNRRVMTRFTLTPWLRVVGWLTAVVMAFCVVGLIASWII